VLKKLRDLLFGRRLANTNEQDAAREKQLRDDWRRDIGQPAKRAGLSPPPSDGGDGAVANLRARAPRRDR
jgi:hypothetical protein